MKVKATLRLDKSKMTMLKESKKKALTKTMDALMTEVVQMQIVPFQDGTLTNSMGVYVFDDFGILTFNTPYARRLYFHPEYNFRGDKNANARGLWMDTFLHGEDKQWLVDTYKTFLKEESGGVIK